MKNHLPNHPIDPCPHLEKKMMVLLVLRTPFLLNIRSNESKKSVGANMYIFFAKRLFWSFIKHLNYPLIAFLIFCICPRKIAMIKRVLYHLTKQVCYSNYTKIIFSNPKGRNKYFVNKSRKLPKIKFQSNHRCPCSLQHFVTIKMLQYLPNSVKIEKITTCSYLFTKGLICFLL